jgi:thioredoxin 2
MLKFSAPSKETTIVILACSSCRSSNRVPPAKLGKRARCGNCKIELTLEAPYPIASAAEFSELVGQSPLPVLVDFWAPWCGPCRVVGPEMEKLARQQSGSLVVAKVNTDEIPEVANRFGIRGIPTFILFKDGREFKRASGAMPAAQIAAAVGFQ